MKTLCSYGSFFFFFNNPRAVIKMFSNYIFFLMCQLFH